jgi:hypothetical protein
MKVIIYTNDDGWVSVATPCYPPNTSTEQESQIAALIQQKDVPTLPDGSARPSFIVDSAGLSGMNLFFEAWRLTPSGSVIWNKAAADELKRKQFRVLRKPLLEKLDVEFMRALESGDNVLVASISTKKKELRDITLIDLSEYDTPEKLNEFLPDPLKNS